MARESLEIKTYVRNNSEFIVRIGENVKYKIGKWQGDRSRDVVCILVHVWRENRT